MCVRVCSFLTPGHSAAHVLLPCPAVSHMYNAHSAAYTALTSDTLFPQKEKAKPNHLYHPPQVEQNEVTAIYPFAALVPVGFFLTIKTFAKYLG